jgi:xylulokinase
MALLGLDAGTTRCKCQVFSETGEILAYEAVEYQPIHYEDGTCVNIAALINGVKTVIGRAAKKCGASVDALCISSFGESFVPLDESDIVLENPMMYSDARGSEESTELSDRLGEDFIIKTSGVKPHSMYSLVKMMWLRRRRPALYERTKRFLLIGDYIIYCLTGEAVIDYSLAARSMAFDVKNKCWSAPLLRAAGIDAALLSSAVMPGTIVGKARPKICAELGLKKDCLVITGAHDQICAALGGGAVAEGQAADGIGTVECITPVFRGIPDLSKMSKYGFACIPFAEDGLYATYAFSYTGGALIKWFRDNLADDTYKRIKTEGRDFYSYFETLMGDAPGSLLVLPYFSGAATPHMDSGAVGAMIGLGLTTSKADIYRGLMEGAAYEMRLNAELLTETGIEISDMTVSGGGASSAKWLQIKADIMGRAVTPLRSSEAGICGAAMLAARATGLCASLEEANTLFVKIDAPVLPINNNVAKYDRQYRQYKKIYGKVKEILS